MKTSFCRLYIKLLIKIKTDYKLLIELNKIAKYDAKNLKKLIGHSVCSLYNIIVVRVVDFILIRIKIEYKLLIESKLFNSQRSLPRYIQNIYRYKEM